MRGDPEPPSPEALALLAAQDWPRIRSGLVAYGIFRKCRPSDAEDFAHAAISRVRSGERSWDPADKPDLLVFLLAEETLESLVDQSDHDEAMERVLSASREDTDRQLAAAGLDPAEQRRKGDAIRRELLMEVTAGEAAKASSPVAPGEGDRPNFDGGTALPGRGARAGKSAALPRWWSPALAAVAVVGVGASVAVGVMHVASKDNDDAGVEAAIAAADLRKQAIAACAAAEWESCARLLDRAAAIDPAGENAPQVKEARRAIGEAHARREGAPDRPPAEADPTLIPPNAPPGSFHPKK